jgi:hypothetical protein
MPSTRTRAKMEDPFHLLPTATLANKQHLDGIIVGTHELNLVKWNISRSKKKSGTFPPPPRMQNQSAKQLMMG